MSFSSPSSGLLPGVHTQTSDWSSNKEAAKREAALIEAATLVLRSLPPTYPLRFPPPHSVIVDSNPLTLSGQLGALFSLAANTSRRLANLNNQFLSPLIGDAPRDEAGEESVELGMTFEQTQYNFLGMTTNFGAAKGQLSLLGGVSDGNNPSAPPLYGKILKLFILDYHYRNTSVVPIAKDVSSIIFGKSYAHSVCGGGSVHSPSSSSYLRAAASSPSADISSSEAGGVDREYPPLGLLITPSTQIVQRMRRAARKLVFRQVDANCGASSSLTSDVVEPKPSQLGVAVAEDFLLSLQHCGLLSLTTTDHNGVLATATTSSSPLPMIVNVYTRPMAANDIRLTAVGVSHLFALPLSPNQYEARQKSDQHAEMDKNSTTTNNASAAAGARSSGALLSNEHDDPTHGGRFAFFAEVDMIEIEIVRVWRVDVARARAEEASTNGQSESQSNPAASSTGGDFSGGGGIGGYKYERSGFSFKYLSLLLALAADEGLDPTTNAIATSVMDWALTKGFGNANHIGISVSERVGVTAGEELGSFVEGEGDDRPDGADSLEPRPLYAVNIAAQVWTENGMSAVTHRIGLSVDGSSLLPSLPTHGLGGSAVCGVAAFLPTSVLMSHHVDVWLLVADYDWVPNTDMCKTHVMNAFTVEEVAKAVRRFREEPGNKLNIGNVPLHELDMLKRRRLGAVLDALHVRTIWACDERLCCEKDAKHVWLQHLRCQLPPTRNLFVFRESMPPQRPGFAVKH